MIVLQQSWTVFC